MRAIVAYVINLCPMFDLNFSSASPSLAFSLVFTALLVLNVLLKWWLAARQIRHVANHRAQVPAAFIAGITLTAHQRAADYTIVKTRFSVLDIGLSAAILLGWTLLGGLNGLNQVWLNGLEPGLVQQLAVLISFMLIGGLLDLPGSWYQTFVIEQQFGFNKMNLRLWVLDLCKSSLLGLLIGLPLLALILWLMQVAGTWWWLWTWGVWMGFNLLLMVIYPSFIAPLFNQFKPLEDGLLKDRVNALMQRCGFAAKGLFVMDASKRSGHGNAYFTGFGAAKRVVFFDTLLEKLAPIEVEAVLAHELGHFKHKHIIKRIASMFVISLLGFALLGWLMQQVWFYTGLGVFPIITINNSTPNNAIALLLFMMVLPVFSFFVAPLSAQSSRRDEFQADAYAVAQTGAEALPKALLKLYEDNASTLTPDPWFVKFYYSHPPASERIAQMSKNSQVLI